VGLLDEVLEHLLRDLEVGDDAVLHGPDRLDVPWGLAEHLLGLGPHRLDPVGDAVDGDDGGLHHGDAAASHVDQGVGGSEIDGEIGREQPEQAG
jgi:hypothetical protein